MKIQSGYQVYAGTSGNAQPFVENIYSKGCNIFLYGVSGSGSVQATLKFKDKYNNDFPVYTFGATSGQPVIFALYPGLLGTSSQTYQTMNGILPEKYHVDTTVNGVINYQLSVNELP